MKRIFSMILAVSLAVTLFAGVSVFAADDDYVYLFDEVQVDGSQVSHAQTGEGYGAVTSADDATDPYFFIQNLAIPSTQKFVAVKYAAESVHLNNLYVSASESGSAPYALDWGADGSWTAPNMTADGEWHLAVYDIAKVFPGVGDLTIGTFRLPGANAGQTINIAYVGFFETEEAAKAFDAEYSAEYGLGVDKVEKPADPADKEDPDDTNEPAEPDDTNKPSEPANPSSGDNSAIALFVLAMMAAASAIVIMRKRSYEG